MSNRKQLCLYERMRPAVLEEFMLVPGKKDRVIRIIEDDATIGLLICGPPGSGKTSMASFIQRASRCVNRIGHNPCGNCWSCREYNGVLIHPRYVFDCGWLTANGDATKEMFKRFHYRDMDTILDNMEEADPAFRRRLLGSLDHWSGGRLIITASDLKRIEPALQQRCRFLYMTNDSVSLHFEWIKVVCLKEGIEIRDENALWELTRLSGPRPRPLLNMIETIAQKKGWIDELDIDDPDVRSQIPIDGSTK